MPHDIITVTPSRLEECVALPSSFGWRSARPVWRTLLGMGAVTGILDGGKLVATMSVLRWPTHMQVGKMIVSPTHQRQGLGSALLQDAIRTAQQEGLSLTLDATSDGAALYSTLGFTAYSETSTYVGVPTHLDIDAVLGAALNDGLRVRPGTDNDLATLPTLDTQAYGYDRRSLTSGIWAEAEHRYILHAADDTAVGFATCWTNDEQLAIGPVIAPTLAGAGALVASLITAATTHQGNIRVEIETGDTPWAGWLTALGASTRYALPRMALGTPPTRPKWSPGTPRLFAQYSHATG